MAEQNASRGVAGIVAVVFGLVLAGIGLGLAIGGYKLVTLGGSWYYALAGLGLLVSGGLFVGRRSAGAWLFGLVLIGTLIWALAEVGLRFWPLVPRLSVMLVLCVFVLLLTPHLAPRRSVGPFNALALLLTLVLIGFGAAMFVPHGVISAGAAQPQAASAKDAEAQADWQYYGRTPMGTRFAPFTQIGRDNVRNLEVAWTFRTGEIAGPGSEDQNTPSQIGDTVYACTPRNKVFAIDADTGAQRWAFDPKVADTKAWNRCRGVGYYDAAADPNPKAFAVKVGPLPPGPCAQRIVVSTIDDRLMEVDAKTGAACQDFGVGGTVDLKMGMGEVKPLFYMPTSAPTVARGLILIGGWVFDNRAVGEPSGVVRAFSARTGELIWAWDNGNPAITRLPPPGQTYTRGTPNVWSTPAFDEKLGLVYLPTGTSTPDYWAAHRTKAAEAYSTAVVALDIESGKERWKFQTVHHDIWDYDLPAQPALYDIPDGRGGVLTALVQVTKRGQIFMLDRRTGVPLAKVEERPVPQGAAPGDWTAPTQPYSVGLPAVGAERITEADMWGATLFDQLWCRIDFRSVRYDGDFTPPGTKPTLQSPGNFGGMNWGSASINEDTGTLIVNDIRLPLRQQLVPHPPNEGAVAIKPHSEFSPQAGTPFAVKNHAFMSLFDIPCRAPPWGTLTGIDLKSRKIIWQIPAGTIADTRLQGVRVSAPIPLGMPTLGGPVTTRSGLVFYAGTQDYYLRAFDQSTGKELWKARLPVGGQATPMTYVSPRSGRQYVVIAAGGTRESPDRGDYVVAFALPKGR